MGTPKLVSTFESYFLTVNYTALALTYLGICMTIAITRLDDWDVVFPIYRTAYFYNELNFVSHISFDWHYTATNPFTAVFGVSLLCSVYSAMCAIGLAYGRITGKWLALVAQGQGIIAMPFIMWITARLGGIVQIDVLVSIYTITLVGHAVPVLFPLYEIGVIPLTTIGIVYPLITLNIPLRQNNSTSELMYWYLVFLLWCACSYHLIRCIGSINIHSVRGNMLYIVHSSAWLVALAVVFTTTGLISLPKPAIPI